MKLAKKKIKQLAAFWNKDERTIRRWLKDNHAMITHQDSQKIIKGR